MLTIRSLTAADLRAALALQPARTNRVDALALGVFDALHVGHRELVRAVVAATTGIPGGVAAIGTFDPHPRAVLFGAAPARLLQDGVRERVLHSWGVRALVTLRVDREFLGMEPDEFALGLKAALGFSRVVVGANFRFGRGRRGTCATLVELLGPDHVVVVPSVEIDGEMVSATRVRGCLAEGDVEAVTQLLGRRYEVEATPERGDGLGRTIGSPTVNLEPVPPALPDGVYAVETSLGPGVVHMGPRPTLGRSERRFELHLLDGLPATSPDDPAGSVRVRFAARLREVTAFPNLDALKAQIAHDIRAAREALEKPTAP